MLFPDHQHCHDSCSDNARKRLDERALAGSKKLGINDKNVFDILLSEHRTFSAYEVSNLTGKNGKKLQANQVYRAFETLIEIGVAHRVELKNGYMACHSENKCEAQQILICKSCNQVAELEHTNLNDAIANSVRKAGFLPEPQKLELLGICPNCSEETTSNY